MSATSTKIKATYEGDRAIVEEAAAFHSVHLTAISEMDSDTTILHLKPKQARRLAKALKKAARKAEG